MIRQRAENEQAPVSWPKPYSEKLPDVTAVRLRKLSIQSLVSLGLVCTTLLTARFPVAPAQSVRRGLQWTVTSDTNFRAHVEQVRLWAAQPGGWQAAFGQWQSDWLNRGQRLLAPIANRLRSTAPPKAAPTPPAMVMPLKGATVRAFGAKQGGRVHEGLDLLAPFGTPVVAVSTGTVRRAVVDPKLGGVIEVDHGSATVIYAQLESFKVKSGDQVQPGQALAVVGRPTGEERGVSSHLHLEVRTPGSRLAVDPAVYLRSGGDQR